MCSLTLCTLSILEIEQVSRRLVLTYDLTDLDPNPDPPPSVLTPRTRLYFKPLHFKNKAQCYQNQLLIFIRAHFLLKTSDHSTQGKENVLIVDKYDTTKETA